MSHGHHDSGQQIEIFQLRRSDLEQGPPILPNDIGEITRRNIDFHHGELSCGACDSEPIFSGWGVGDLPFAFGDLADEIGIKARIEGQCTREVFGEPQDVHVGNDRQSLGTIHLIDKEISEGAVKIATRPLGGKTSEVTVRIPLPSNITLTEIGADALPMAVAA